MKLSRLNRLRAFEIARFAWQKSRGDSSKAKEIVNTEARKLGLDPILMGLLIQLALYFLKRWMEGDQSNNELGMGEFEIPTEYTPEIEAEVLAAFPEEMDPGTL